MSKRLFQPVIFVLLVAILTTAFGWAFNGEIFTHDLEHEHHVLSRDPAAHLEAHRHDSASFSDGDSRFLDVIPHLCLQVCGQYPISSTTTLLVPVSIGREVLAVFVPVTVPESVPDSPLHPPKNSFAI